MFPFLLALASLLLLGLLRPGFSHRPARRILLLASTLVLVLGVSLWMEGEFQRRDAMDRWPTTEARVEAVERGLFPSLLLSWQVEGILYQGRLGGFPLPWLPVADSAGGAPAQLAIAYSPEDPRQFERLPIDTYGPVGNLFLLLVLVTFAFSYLVCFPEPEDHPAIPALSPYLFAEALLASLWPFLLDHRFLLFGPLAPLRFAAILILALALILTFYLLCYMVRDSQDY